MICLACGSNSAETTSQCRACSSFNVITSPHTTPSTRPEFREKLLQFYLDFATSQALSNWLEDIGQNPKGTVEEKRERIRLNTKYLSMSPETFPLQTMKYLMPYTGEHLSKICNGLGVNGDGSKNSLFRRICREVGYREGWLGTVTREDLITKPIALSFVQWYPVLKHYEYEKDYYEDFYDEMAEVFGAQNVHEQLAIAYGNTLKIDFHIGHPQQGGVGIEFKMPTSNSELQRALGQMDQYTNRYRSELIVLLIPDFLSDAQLRLFIDELCRKNITAVVKTKVV